MRLFPALFAALCLCFPGLLGSSEPGVEYSFQTLGVPQGMQHLGVRCLYLDQEGYLWVGTQDGLHRHETNRLQGFGLSQGLPSTHISDLREDRHGTLWVGTFRGLAFRQGPRFEAVTLAGAAGLRVLGLSQDSQENLWVATDQGPYFQAGPRAFHADPRWPGGPVHALSPGPDGRLYATSGTRLWERLPGGAWKAHPRWGKGGPDIIHSLALDGQKRLWGRTRSALLRWEEEGQRWSRQQPALPPTSLQGLLSVDGQGRLWVTHDMGVSFLEREVWTHIGRPQGLNLSRSRAVLLDPEGNLWVGSTGLQRWLGLGGLLRVSLPQSPSSDAIRILAGGSGAAPWVGTDEGLLHWNQGKWLRIPGSEGYSIRSAAFHSDGNVFLAGYPATVLTWKPGGRARPLDLPEDLLGQGRIFALLEDGDRGLWVATEDRGLVHLEQQGPRWTGHRVDLPKGTKGERFSDLLRDDRGRLWAAGDQGLACLDKGTWLRFRDQDGLRQTHVAYLAQGAAGSLLVAYFEPLGLSALSMDSGRLQILGHLDRNQGLASNKVFAMAMDPQGILWVGTGLGLNAVEAPFSERPRATHFTSEDGLVSDDCNARSLALDSRGRVWVGTMGGLGLVDPSRLRLSLPAPPARILSLSLGQEPLDLREPLRIRAGDLAEGLLVRVGARGYAFPARLERQVRLLGLGEAWRTTTTGEVQFPVLTPGSYTLETRARYGEGPWGEVAQYAFAVAPRFHQTRWFKGLMLLLSVSTLGILVRWRIRKLQAEAMSDPLTGLLNRRGLGLLLPRDAEQALRNATTPAATPSLSDNRDLILLMVDLDHFKAVNDTHGHEAGDRVLVQLSEILKGASRGSDAVYRLGGEEFLLVARRTSRSFGRVLSERVRAAVANHPFDIGTATPLKITCSVGACPFPLQRSFPRAFSWEEALHVVDHCLFAAKRNGRNRFVFLHPGETSPLPRVTGDFGHTVPGWVTDGFATLETSSAPPPTLVWDLAGEL